MNRQYVKEMVGWGIGLWLIGYVLGFLFFPFVPIEMLGWVISPIGIVITLWVLFKKIKGSRLGYFVSIGVAWAVIAIVFDYAFLVKLLRPEDGYYKMDVYLYYVVTLLLPILVGWMKARKASEAVIEKGEK